MSHQESLNEWSHLSQVEAIDRWPLLNSATRELACRLSEDLPTLCNALRAHTPELVSDAAKRKIVERLSTTTMADSIRARLVECLASAVPSFLRPKLFHIFTELPKSAWSTEAGRALLKVCLDEEDLGLVHKIARILPPEVVLEESLVKRTGTHCLEVLSCREWEDLTVTGKMRVLQIAFNVLQKCQSSQESNTLASTLCLAVYVLPLSVAPIKVMQLLQVFAKVPAVETVYILSLAELVPKPTPQRADLLRAIATTLAARNLFDQAKPLFVEANRITASLRCGVQGA